MRRSRWLAVGIAAAVVPAMAMPIMAQGGDAHSSKIEALVADLDGAGNVTSLHTTGLLRVYADGSFSVDDGGTTQTGTAKGSKDLPFDKPLQLTNGLVQTPNGLRALPVAISTVYKLNGAEVPADQLAGKSGDFEIDVTVTNRTLRTETVNYTDATTGKPTSAVGQTAIPINVAVTGLELPDANFDGLETTGIMGRSADGKATNVTWVGYLAPPLFPGTQTLTVKGKTNGFKMSAPEISAQMGATNQLPSSLQSTLEKGGADVQTLRGYFKSFGDGFGQLGGGLGLIKGGVDGVMDGLNNTKFDRPAYDKDSTIPTNQPGVLEGLHVLDDGLQTLKSSIGQVRAGLSTGNNANPGVIEGLKLIEAGIGSPSDGASLLGAVAKVRAGVQSGDPKNPGLVEGLKQIQAGIGDGTDPLTILGGLNAIKAALSSGDPAHPAILEGLQQMTAGLGSAGNPLTILGGLTAIRAGLSTGSQATPGLLEALQQITAGIGTGAPAETVGGKPLTIVAGLNASAGGLDQIIPGLQAAVAGIGDGTDPTKVAGALAAIRAGVGTGADSEFDCTGDGVGGDPGCGLAQAAPPPPTPPTARPLTAQATMLTFSATLTNLKNTFVALVNGQLLGLGATPLDGTQSAVVSATLNAFVDPLIAGIGDKKSFDCTGDGVKDTYGPACNEGTPGAKALSLESSFAQVFTAIGNGTEFSGTTPLTLRAGLAAIVAGLGTAGNPNSAIGGLSLIRAGIGNSATAGTVLNALATIQGGLATKIVPGVQQIVGGLGDAATQKSIIGGLTAIRAGLSSGDPKNPAVVEGVQQIVAGLGSATNATSLIGGLSAIHGANDQLIAGLILIYNGLGNGTEKDAKGQPGSLSAGMQFIAGSLGKGTEITNGKPATLIAGLNLIVTGLGDLNPDGTAVKAVTVRQGKFAPIETPATALYALEAVHTGLAKFFTGFGSRTVKQATPTLLNGLFQLSDGLSQAAAGAGTGSSGATTLTGITKSTVIGTDQDAAFQTAGAKRAENYTFFVSAPNGASTKTMFLFRMPAIG